MIVKIQQSLSSTDGVKYCFIYDRSRRIHYETSDPEETKPLLALLGDNPKGYYNAEIDSKGKIIIKDQVTDQKEW